MKTRNSSFELNILVSGRPITEYEYNGRILVQGRKGSEFEVEFKNHTNARVLVIPAVDNKSVLDGQTATPDSKGYVVKAHGSVRIPGWTLDGNSVANFTFEDKDKSYASQTTQDATAVQAGVIGVLVFEEKVAPKPEVVHHHHHYTKTVTPGILPYPTAPFYPGTPQWPYNGPTWTSAGDPLSTMLGASVSVNNAMDAKSAKTLSVTRSSSHENTASSASLSSDGMVVSNAAPIEGAFEMGTGFGKRADFKTNDVKFQKGDLKVEMSIYYDSRRNLEKRGIVVAPRETRYLDEFPSAFSGTGCNPPPGWQG